MNVSKLKPLVLALAACTYSATGLQVALADDTEIYVPKEVPLDQQVRPNILLVLDTSGSMGSTVSGTGRPLKTRIEVLREVVHNLVDDLKDQNVNLGFMRFHGSDGGAVTKAVTQLTPSNAATFKSQIDSTIVANGNTPMSETYYEAYRYLAGLKPVWGIHSATHRKGTDLNALIPPATLSGYTSWKYNSPISHSCQKTHIVYITDGAPVSDVGSNTAIRTLITDAKDPQDRPTNTEFTSSTCKTSDGQCLPHLAEYMYNQDMGAAGGYPKKFSDPSNRKQNVTSHFVGFALNLELLQNAARAGGGQYFTTSTASGLSDALNSIIVDITAENTTFVAPSIAVTAYNNFGFRDELYYALFRPSEGTNWLGNLKKYRMKTKDSSDKPITPVVVDANGNAAISEETGFFRENSRSYWSSSIDGEDVGKGGFASTLNSGSRKIYTWYGADRAPGTTGSDNLKLFFNNGTIQSAANSAVTNAHLGAADGTQRTHILNWIKGIKDTNVQRKAIGDVLHNEPRLVSYVTDEDIVRAESSSSLEQVIIFIGTNEGFIHAVDAKTGTEKFAFLPKELQSIPGKYMKDDKGYNNKAYGMDGHFTLWTEYGARKANSTRDISKANLYAGMRRGGSNYYALDVLNLNQPKLKWVIKGAVGNTAVERTPGFDKLGLTFSAARLGEMMVGATRTKVLVFSGGYDPDHDEVGSNMPRNDNLGNALYVVNADTGALIWRATSSNASGTGSDITGKTQLIPSMTNSMPASPAVLDVDGDGLIDIIYASDLRGQLFRFDVNHGSTGSALLNGQLFAKLGGTDKANNRRFFTTPDVALIRDKGQEAYFTVSLGSGFRESPLNEETSDRFYMIRDRHVSSALPAGFTPLTESDLTDASGLSGANQASVQAQVDIYQGQIDALNAAVIDQENAFQQLKDTTGFTAAYEEYLAQLRMAQELQGSIDEQTELPYDPFEISLADSADPYNKSYLKQHAAEYQAQSDVQNILLKLNQAFNDATDSNVKEALARAYEAIKVQQIIDEEAQAKRIKQENFVLKGHLQPALTDELKNEIDDLFGPLGIDYDDYGDFSDLAYILSGGKEAGADPVAEPAVIGQIEQSYSAQDLGVRNALIAGIASLDAALSALLEDPVDGSLLTTWINDMRLVPGASTEPSDSLEVTESKADTLKGLAKRFGDPQGVIDSKQTELDAATYAASVAADDANDIATNPAFAAAEAAVEAAYAATRHPTTGIYALRVKINEEYGKLDVADVAMTAEQLSALKGSSGFFVRMSPGEKVLSDSVSYNGTVLFSTFTPRGQSVSECGSDVGVGRTFALSLRTAEGVFTEQLPDGTTRYVRSQLNKQAGIPPTPVIVITEGDPSIPPGLECEGGICSEPGSSPVSPTYWREEEAD